MKLEYVSNPPNFTSEEDQAVLKRVEKRRGEKGLLPLDLALLHAPKLADGWNSLLGAVRTQNSLADNIREICILRPALINGAWFEWRSHLPIFQASNSYSPEKLETIQERDPRSRGALTDAEWAVLQYADGMTKNVTVSQELFNQLRSHGGFNEQEIVEITTTVAAYNMVSRFLVALDVGECNDKPPEFAASSKSSADKES